MPAGVLIASLTDGGPAAAAGLRPGDLILAVDGDPTPSVDAVHRLLGRKPIGRTLALRVLRAGKLVDVLATVSGRPEDTRPADPRAPASSARDLRRRGPCHRERGFGCLAVFQVPGGR